MAAAVVTQNAAMGGTFVPGAPEASFPTHPAPGNFKQPFDVARDGRFLIDTDLQDASTEPVHLLLNRHPPAK